MKYYPSCGKAAVESTRFCPQCGRAFGLPGRQTKPDDVGCVSPQDNDAVSHREPRESQMPGQKQRHGCLTAYLVLVIIANSALAFWYIFEGLAVFGIGVLLIIAAIFNVVCAIALLKWKKWGFWGVIASFSVLLCLNLYIGLGPASFSGLVGIGVLYGVLQIGKENKGWPQLD